MATSQTVNVTGPNGGRSIVCSFRARDGVTVVDRSVAVRCSIAEKSATGGAGSTLQSWSVDCRQLLDQTLGLGGLTAAQVGATVAGLIA